MFEGCRSVEKAESICFSPSNKEIIYLRGKNDDLTDALIARNFNQLREIASYVACDNNISYSFVYIPEVLKEDSVKERREYFNPESQDGFDSVSHNIVYEFLRKQIFGANPVPEEGIFLIYDSENEMFRFREILAKDDTALVSEFQTFRDSLPRSSRLISFYSSTITPDIEGMDFEEEDSDDTFEEEIEKISFFIRNSIAQLRGYGVDEAIIQALFLPQQKLSRLILTEDYRIILPDYDNMEIKMEPLPKTLYILFLRHPEGMMFKELGDHFDELVSIYKRITNRLDISNAIKSLERLTDPFDNSVNEKCCRIKEAFISKFDDNLARNYNITGQQGTPKRVVLDRGLVDEMNNNRDKINGQFSNDNQLKNNDNYYEII